MDWTWIKRAGLAAVGLALIGGLAYALREKPVLVDVATVASGPMKVTIREEGMTRVREVYAISAPIAGHLERTLLEQGDPVEGGETEVASIRPLDPPLLDWRTAAELEAARDAARAAVGIAETELKRGQTALRLAEEELERASKLHGPGIISESALRRAENEVTLLRAQVEAAEETIRLRQAQLSSAEARLAQPETAGMGRSDCCVSLIAPVDGVVLEMFVRSEQAVASGTRIAEVGNPDDLEITVDLLSSDAVRIGPGSPAIVSDWGGGSDFAATVRRVEPAAFTKVSALGIEEQRVNAVLDFKGGDHRLGHNYRVFVELEVWSCETCLRVPIAALFRDGQDWSVFAVRDGRLEKTLVEVGHMNDEVAEVTGGVEAGTVVVVHPSDTLADGTLVEIRD